MKDVLKIEKKILKALTKEREKQGMSVYKLSQLSGLSQNAIALIEKGDRHPTLKTCLSIAAALNVDLADIIKQSR